LALTCILGAVSTALALEKIGYFSLAESALIVYAAHFSLSMSSYFYHYQLFGFEISPAFLFIPILVLRDFKSQIPDYSVFIVVGLESSISTLSGAILFALDCYPCTSLYWSWRYRQRGLSGLLDKSRSAT